MCIKQAYSTLVSWVFRIKGRSGYKQQYKHTGSRSHNTEFLQKRLGPGDPYEYGSSATPTAHLSLKPSQNTRYIKTILD